MSQLNSSSTKDKKDLINSKDNNVIEEKKLNTTKFDLTISNLLRTMNKFTICLNSKTIQNISFYNHTKVCFILINTYENENEDLGMGPLNDSIHIALYYHKLHYKVFYLYNPQSNQFINFLDYFLKNTKKALTVFYSGYGSNNSSIHEIKFPNGHLSSDVIQKSLSQNCNGKAKVTLLTNTFNGGPVFDIHSINLLNDQQSSDIISFWVKKEKNNLKLNESKRSHGIFIYYFFKIISDFPNITPKELVEKVNPSIESFNEFLKYDVTNTDLIEAPLLQ